MGSIDMDRGPAVEALPVRERVRSRPIRLMAEFEGEIRQLYGQMMDEPVPAHLRDILRAALAAKP